MTTTSKIAVKALGSALILIAFIAVGFGFSTQITYAGYSADGHFYPGRGPSYSTSYTGYAPVYNTPVYDNRFYPGRGGNSYGSGVNVAIAVGSGGNYGNYDGRYYPGRGGSGRGVGVGVSVGSRNSFFSFFFSSNRGY